MLTPSQIDRKFALQAELSKDVRDHTVLTPLHAAAEGSADAAAEAEVTGVTHRKTPVCLDEAHQEEDAHKVGVPAEAFAHPAGHNLGRLPLHGDIYSRHPDEGSFLRSGEEAVRYAGYDPQNVTPSPSWMKQIRPDSADRPSPQVMSGSRFPNDSGPLADGHAANSPSYDAPTSARVPAGQPSAHNLTRPYLTDGHAANSPSNG